MIKITRLTDYGIVLLAYFVKDDQHPVRTARDLAAQSHLPLPTVSKILKVMARKGLLAAHRGPRGGFNLSRPAEKISVAQIVDAVEGHMGITQCSYTEAGRCELEDMCPTQTNWQKISQAVWGALEHITLADMARPLHFEFAHHLYTSGIPPTLALPREGGEEKGGETKEAQP